MRQESTADALNAWYRYKNAALREALPRPSLLRRLYRFIRPVVGPALVLVFPPLGIVWLALFSR